jgi:hypothetical protein
VTAQHDANVAHLAPLGADQRPQILRPSPARLIGDPTDRRIAHLDELELAATNGPDLIRN